MFFPEMSICENFFDKTKCMCFVVKDEKLLDKHMKVWEKVRNIIKK